MSSIEFLIPYTLTMGSLKTSFAISEIVLATKLIPKGLEGTCVAILTTVSNLSTVTLGKLYGTWINDSFIQITNEKMQNESEVENGLKDISMIKIQMIQMALILLSIPIALLIPKREAIDKF